MTKYLHLSVSVFMLCILVSCQSTASSPLKNVQTEIVPTQIENRPTSIPPVTAQASPTNPIPVGPSTITPENAAMVKQIGSLGIGTMSSVIWSPMGDQLAVTSASGICLFSSKTLYLERCFGNGLYSSIEFSPDGRLIAATLQLPDYVPMGMLSGSAENIEIWDLVNANLLSTLNQDSQMWRFVTFSPEGNRLASISNDGGVYIWNLNAKEFEKKLGCQSRVTGITGMNTVAFIPFSDQIACISDQVTTDIWQISDNKKVFSFPSDDPQIVDVSPDGSLLAAFGNDVTVWKLQKQEEVFHVSGGGCFPVIYTYCEITPDGQYLYFGNILWDIQSQKAVGKFSDTGFSNNLSPDGRSIASITDQVLTISQINVPTNVLQFGSESEQSITYLLSPSQKYLAVGGSGKTQLWDLQKQVLVITISSGIPIGNNILHLAFSPDENYLAAVDDALDVIVWNVADGSFKYFLPGNYGNKTPVITFSPDSHSLIIGGDYYLFSIDLANPENLVRSDISDTIVNIAYDLRGSSIIANTLGDSGTAITFYDPKTLVVVDQISLGEYYQNDESTSIAFYPSGDYFAIQYQDGMEIYQISTKDLFTVNTSNQGSQSNTNSGKQPKLLVSYLSGIVQEYDLNTGSTTNYYFGPFTDIAYLTYSNDGSVVYAGSMDGFFYEWNVGDIGVRSKLVGGPYGISGLSISKDGKFLTVIGQPITIWDIQSRSALFSVFNYVNNLSPQAVNAMVINDDSGTMYASELSFLKVYNQLPSILPTTFSGEVSSFITSPTRKYLAVYTTQGEVDLYNFETMELLHTWLLRFPLTEPKMIFNPDEVMLYVTQEPMAGFNDIAALNITSGEEQYLGTQETETLVLSIDGSTLASAYWNAEVFDAHTFTELSNIHSGDQIKSIALSPDGKVLVTVSETTELIQTGNDIAATPVVTSEIALWDTRTGNKLNSFTGNDTECAQVIFNPDGESFISATCMTGMITIWGIQP